MSALTEEVERGRRDHLSCRLGGGACDLMGEVMLVCEEGEPVRPDRRGLLNQASSDRKTSAFRCGGWGSRNRSASRYSRHSEPIEKQHPLAGRGTPIPIIVAAGIPEGFRSRLPWTGCRGKRRSERSLPHLPGSAAAVSFPLQQHDEPRRSKAYPVRAVTLKVSPQPAAPGSYTSSSQ